MHTDASASSCIGDLLERFIRVRALQAPVSAGSQALLAAGGIDWITLPI